MAKDAINVLTNLDTLGVSLVRRGANKRKFAITKSEEVMDEKDIELLSTVLKEAGYDGEEKLAEAIAKQQLGEKEQNAIKGALRILNAFRDNAEIKKLADMLAAAVGYPPPNGGYPAPKMPDDAKKPSYPTPMAKAIEGLPSEQRAAMEPVLKAIYESVEASAVERIQKAEERAAKTEEILKAERDERLRKEFVAKAVAEYDKVPGKPEELGLVLKSLHDVDPGLCKKVEAVLKSTQAVLKESALFVEKGRSGESVNDNDPWAQIQKAADSAAAQ